MMPLHPTCLLSPRQPPLFHRTHALLKRMSRVASFDIKSSTAFLKLVKSLRSNWRKPEERGLARLCFELRNNVVRPLRGPRRDS